jgi:hypothetical protein
MGQVITFPIPKLTLTVSADTAPIRAAIDEVTELLNTRDVSPELRDNMLATLRAYAQRPTTGALCEFGPATAIAPDELRIEVKPGRLIENTLRALRALPTREEPQA